MEKVSMDRIVEAYVADPGNFLNNLALVQTFYQEKIWTANPRILLDNEGTKLIPVFTNQAAYDAYIAGLGTETSFETLELPLVYVAEVVNEQNLGGILINPDMDSMVAFLKEDLNLFLTYHSRILQRLVDEESEPLHFVPGFAREDASGQIVRTFPYLETPNGDRYIPVFTRLDALANWYGAEHFGLPFRQEGGMIFPWSLEQFLLPESGRHDRGETKGYVLNPFIEEKPEGIKHLWDE